MIDAFELRLADLLADRLAGASPVQLVTRVRDGVAALVAGRARVTVRVLGAQPSVELGDDRRHARRVQMSFELRTLLRLEGAVLVEVEVASAQSDTGGTNQRAALVDAVDRVLVALHAEDVRDGSAFDTDEDLGFELDAFRLERVEARAEGAPDARFFDLHFRYTGRFWPVEPPVAGEIIDVAATRMATLPLRIPTALVARPGGADLRVPIELELRARG